MNFNTIIYTFTKVCKMATRVPETVFRRFPKEAGESSENGRGPHLLLAGSASQDGEASGPPCPAEATAPDPLPPPQLTSPLRGRQQPRGRVLRRRRAPHLRAAGAASPTATATHGLSREGAASSSSRRLRGPGLDPLLPRIKHDRLRAHLPLEGPQLQPCSNSGRNWSGRPPAPLLGARPDSGRRRRARRKDCGSGPSRPTHRPQEADRSGASRADRQLWNSSGAPVRNPRAGRAAQGQSRTRLCGVGTS
uniref:Uncharacterized protein LOC117312749 n=1 Tax=Tursiops truncatus TaxID=9739 RepID=A0A6J3RL82_TURTR|nr:uncharacterized protein LOC117312749 [Tursiops truncatus]